MQVLNSVERNFKGSGDQLWEVDPRKLISIDWEIGMYCTVLNF
jgi:hypothetical protein